MELPSAGTASTTGWSKSRWTLLSTPCHLYLWLILIPLPLAAHCPLSTSWTGIDIHTEDRQLHRTPRRRRACVDLRPARNHLQARQSKEGKRAKPCHVDTGKIPEEHIPGTSKSVEIRQATGVSQSGKDNDIRHRPLDVHFRVKQDRQERCKEGAQTGLTSGSYASCSDQRYAAGRAV